MTPTKINRGFAKSGVPAMPTVRAHILRTLSAQRDALQACTSGQLAAVINLIHQTYHEGRAATGASIEDDALWIGAGVDKLVPLAALRAITIDEQSGAAKRPYAGFCYPHASTLHDNATGLMVDRDLFEQRKLAGVKSSYHYTEHQHETHYKMDYTERC